MERGEDEPELGEEKRREGRFSARGTLPPGKSDVRTSVWTRCEWRAGEGESWRRRTDDKPVFLAAEDLVRYLVCGDVARLAAAAVYHPF